MKSFAVAAFAGAASAAWAPPAYGGQSSAVESSSAPAEYAPPAYESTTETAPAYETMTTSSASAPAYTMPAYGASSSSMTTYACNPAHSYPNGASCISTYGTLSLVTPTASATSAYGTGNTAPAYPHPTGSYGWNNGTQGGHGGYGETVTQIVTSLETYCPGPTTLTYNSKTYTVTEATTLTVTDCPCEVTKPATEYQPSYTTDVVTEYTTYCPEATEVSWYDQTYTVSASQTLTVTGFTSTVSKEVPATWVVSEYTTVCPSPAVPTTVTVGTQTYPVSEETTIVVTAPTSYATYTSVYTQPQAPTTAVVDSTTYPISEATSIVYSMPTYGGVTVTAPYSEIWTSAPPAASTPAVPVSPVQPSAGYPGVNGSSPVSPNMPAQQTGNGAGRIVAGSAVFGAVVGALFL